VKKLGFCFLIYDIINLESLWDLFFKGVDTSKYHIYIHYKVNTPLLFFEKYKLDTCIPTKYADISLIHAMNILFKRAYDDDCTKMIMVSQACIPFKSFNYIYELLTKDDFGYFNMFPRRQCFPNCRQLCPSIDRNFIHKSHQWFILNRTLCDMILQNSVIIDPKYLTVNAPEEVFYITTVYINKLQDQIITTDHIPTGTTFTNWSEMRYVYRSKSGLKNYSSITSEELNYIISSKSLFGRKFTPECLSSLSVPIYLDTISNKE